MRAGVNNRHAAVRWRVALPLASRPLAPWLQDQREPCSALLDVAGAYLG